MYRHPHKVSDKARRRRQRHSVRQQRSTACGFRRVAINGEGIYRMASLRGVFTAPTPPSPTGEGAVRRVGLAPPSYSRLLCARRCAEICLFHRYDYRASAVCRQTPPHPSPTGGGGGLTGSCRSGIHARRFFAVGHKWPTYARFVGWGLPHVAQPLPCAERRAEAHPMAERMAGIRGVVGRAFMPDVF